MSDDTQTTFKAAYGVLQRHADLLRNQREPNIDDLLKIVTESVDAYKVCQARIAAVDQALEATLAQARPARAEDAREEGAGGEGGALDAFEDPVLEEPPAAVRSAYPRPTYPQRR